MFDHNSEKKNALHYYNVLLLVAIVCCFAVDTSICERGFSLINMLKTAKRSRMGTKLLRMLMTICTLGAEWKDPAKIPAEQIIDIWREESKGGRYENKLMWGLQGLRGCEGRERGRGRG
uniref:HAT C-terminal dimerisation domain-containing protein n=1 Tax=Coccolithus braarudii TaxID=221442 RepID=A0A7S0Q1D0_9EUKA